MTTCTQDTELTYATLLEVDCNNAKLFIRLQQLDAVDILLHDQQVSFYVNNETTNSTACHNCCFDKHSEPVFCCVQ